MNPPKNFLSGFLLLIVASSVWLPALADDPTGLQATVSFVEDDEQLQSIQPIYDRAMDALEILQGLPTSDFAPVALLVRNNGIGLRRTSCTGTLIAPNLVLTAAHCFYYAHPKRKIRQLQNSIFFQTKTFSEEMSKWSIYFDQAGLFSVESAFIYPEFRQQAAKMPTCPQDQFGGHVPCMHGALMGDVAIVKLSKPVETVQPAKLVQTSTLDSSKLEIVGYGIADQARGYADSQIKRWGLATPASCENSYEFADVHHDFHICFPNTFDPGDRNEPLPEFDRDTCAGDSGGPVFKQPSRSTPDRKLRTKYTLVGVTSAGYRLDAPLTCDSVTRVAPGQSVSIAVNLASDNDDVRKLRQWIDTIISEHSESPANVNQHLLKRWGVVSEFSDDEEVHRYRLSFEKGYTPNRVVVTLNGAKGNHVDEQVEKLSQLSSAQISDTSLVRRLIQNEFDLKLSKHRQLAGTIGSCGGYVNLKFKGEHLLSHWIDHPDITISNCIGPAPDCDLISTSCFTDVPYGTLENNAAMVYESLVECNQDQPGTLGACVLDKEDNWFETDDQIEHWTIAVNRISGQGEYQLSILVYD